MSDFSVWKKSLELIENLKVSAESTSSFLAIEPKTKMQNLRNLYKRSIQSGESYQGHFFYKKMIVKSKNLPKYKEKELSSGIEDT